MQSLTVLYQQEYSVYATSYSVICRSETLRLSSRPSRTHAWRNSRRRPLDRERPIAIPGAPAVSQDLIRDEQRRFTILFTGPYSTRNVVPELPGRPAWQRVPRPETGSGSASRRPISTAPEAPKPYCPQAFAGCSPCAPEALRSWPDGPRSGACRARGTSVSKPPERVAPPAARDQTVSVS